MIKKLGLSLAALVTCAGIAIAAGAFQGFPKVGDLTGNINCLSFGNNGVCNQYAPAGPASLTGNETFPADTNLGAGQPSTILVSPATLNAGPTIYNVPLTGASITATNVTRQVVINPAGTIAAFTLVMPPAAPGTATALVDNQRLGFCSTQIVTSLTVTPGSGAAVNSAPSAMTAPVTTGAASCVEWVYVQSAATWFRVQ